MLLMPHLITPFLHLKPSVPCSNKVPLPQNEPPCISPVKTEPPWLSFCLFCWPKPAFHCASLNCTLSPPQPQHTPPQWSPLYSFCQILVEENNWPECNFLAGKYQTITISLQLLYYQFNCWSNNHRIVLYGKLLAVWPMFIQHDIPLLYHSTDCKKALYLSTPSNHTRPPQFPKN